MEELLNRISSLSINESPCSGVPMCMKMCPKTEMLFREQNGLLHRLEMINPAEQWSEYKKLNWKKNPRRNRTPFTDHEKAVKQYQRSSAGQRMDDFQMIRSTEVLRQTVDYLLTECFVLKIFDNDQSQFGRPEIFDYCYDFVFDRLRSIRQDLVIQQAFDHHCLYIFERCIEFYIYSSYMFSQFSDVSFPKPISFDAHINQTHLKECLQMLMVYYDSFNDSLWSRKRATFESLFILFHLRPQIDMHGFERYRNLKTMNLDGLLDRMSMIRSLIKSYLTQSHIRILRIISEEKIPKLLMVSFLITNVSIHHSYLLQLICKAYRSPTITRLPLSVLAQWFCPNGVDQEKIIDYLESLLKLHQIPVEIYPPIDHFSDGNQPCRAKYAILNKNYPIRTFPTVNSDLTPTSWLEPFSLKAEILKNLVPFE